MDGPFKSNSQARETGTHQIQPGFLLAAAEANTLSLAIEIAAEHFPMVAGNDALAKSTGLRAIIMAKKIMDRANTNFFRHNNNLPENVPDVVPWTMPNRVTQQPECVWHYPTPTAQGL